MNGVLALNGHFFAAQKGYLSKFPFLATSFAPGNTVGAGATQAPYSTNRKNQLPAYENVCVWCASSAQPRAAVQGGDSRLSREVALTSRFPSATFSSPGFSSRHFCAARKPGNSIHRYHSTVRDEQLTYCERLVFQTSATRKAAQQTGATGFTAE